MPYKDVTYDNGFTERVYYDETPEEEALRMSRTNRAKAFPSANHRTQLQVLNQFVKNQSQLDD